MSSNNNNYYTVKCHNCNYQFTDQQEWMAKLKCGAHRRYSKGRHYSYVIKSEGNSREREREREIII